ncbi:MAG: T9SS type A sorting domain-containing protein [Flaviramulus sp.]|nr:T9SS type A sorting domain-containing protein [Flaviramulus sp.]
MKKNTFKLLNRLLAAIILFVVTVSYSQDIHFTFANTQNTNDGMNDFFETDVMIQTINATGSFKLGSGQLYFTYNTLAFGENIFANSKIEVTQPNAGGYICGQYVDAAAASIYGTFTINDNTTARVSWAFSQAFSSSTFAADNVTPTATKLCHLKLQYVDVNLDPMVLFEEGAIYLDQFYTACGPTAGGPFESANCGTDPGTQLFNDTFDSGGATLSDYGVEALLDFSIYPNPTSEDINISSNSIINKVEIFDLLGKKVLNSTETNQIKITHLPIGIFILKAYAEKGTVTKKIVIE